MIQSPLGTIEIYKNGKRFSYVSTELPTVFRHFFVDGRCQINLRDITKGTVMEILLVSSFPVLESEDGDENLIMKFFEYKNVTVGISIEEIIPNVDCDYLARGVRLSFLADTSKIRIGVSWLQSDIETRQLPVWYAIDTDYR